MKTEELRQKQFDNSLVKIKEELKIENIKELVNCYVNIANADDFIHEKEVSLIKHAIEVWGLDIRINKPTSGKKLKIKE